MLGVEGYGSGSDNDSDAETTTTTTAKPVPTKPTATPKPGISLPPPKQAKRPKKIVIDLPKSNEGDDVEDGQDQPPTKKARRDGKGAGVSSLLSMLPAPKQVAPAQPPKPERVLGGGNAPALSFGPARRSANDDPNTSTVAKPNLFTPNSVTRGKANVSTEDSVAGPSRPRVSPSPAVDFFSLGQSTSRPSPQQSKTLPTSLPSISSAPKIEEFIPPEPTPQDEYPGYYRLPSGTWAAYDTEYYQKFYRKWQADYDKYVRDLEKGKIKGFEDLDEESTRGVDAMEEMAKAREEIQVKEERKALTQAQDQTAAPRMNIKGAALSGRARSRGQLATLLTEAYQNREAYEDKIAQGRRNRKEAGNKYGF